MKLLSALILTILCFVAFSTSAAQQAPNWQLKTQAGKIIRSSDYQGQPIILHFWATWCPYCRRLQPKLVELQHKYKDQGVKIVAISILEDEGAKPQDEIDQRGYDFITAVKGETVATQYGVRGTPTTFFINRNNDVVFATSSSDVNDPRFELSIKEMIKKH